MQDKLLSPFDLYIVQLLALYAYCSPRIMQMLCGLRLSLHSDETTAPMSIAKLYHLFTVAISSMPPEAVAECCVCEAVQLLAMWEPGYDHYKGSYASQISHFDLDALCELAEKHVDNGERAAVLDVLHGLGGEAYRESRALARASRNK